ncbi:small kinetochore-associated protein [Pseudophryne corroboree]|uniref:small kinetochore-associated protein n=1 Tax=Pseudophryne corroboree TaxID=495146 RepID=UPI003081F1C8
MKGLATMERSKLPVRSQAANATDPVVSCAKKPCPQKTVLPLFSRDPNIAFSSSAHDLVVFKAAGNGKKALLPKKTIPPVRGPGNQYIIESELRDRNRLLEAANNSLHGDLVSTQNMVKELIQQRDAAKKELQELNRRMDRSLVILESRNIDPVSGDRIIAAAEETSKVREETKAFTENLLNELKRCSNVTVEHRDLVQCVREKWKEAQESRHLFLEEQQAFQSDLQQFRSSLQETQKWLDL